MSVEHFDASDVTSVDDLKSSRFLEEGGQYHLVVAEVDESREKSNAGIFVKFGVLAGTTKGQENKQFNELFVDPSGSQKDGGAFCKKRRLALLLATGVITPDMLGKAFSVNWQDLVERQLKAAVIVEETASKDDATKKYKNAKIRGLDMWGPLDEAAKHIPHDEACIEAAVRRGQVNVVKNYKGAVKPTAQPGVSTNGTAAPAAAAAGAAGDKYAGL